MSKVRLGLIGHGRLGSIHAEHIGQSEHMELYAVCDDNPEALAAAQQRYVTRTFSVVDDLLEQPIDGVVIASNTQQHEVHIKAAAEAGKHIFTEKPIGLSMAASDVVLQAVKDAGVKFQIGFQRRWDPQFVGAKNAMHEGKIGVPVMFKAYGRDPNASNPANWGLDKNGGLFLNAAIHDYDAALFLLEQEPLQTSATGAALVHLGLKEHGDIDTCSTTLLLGNNTMAITEWSRFATYGYDVAAEVIGTEGIIRIHHGSANGTGLQKRDDAAPGVFDVFRNAYRAELDAFVCAIKDDFVPSPSVEDARLALHIALLARQSYVEGKMLTIPKLAPLR